MRLVPLFSSCLRTDTSNPYRLILPQRVTDLLCSSVFHMLSYNRTWGESTRLYLRSTANLGFSSMTENLIQVSRGFLRYSMKVLVGIQGSEMRAGQLRTTMDKGSMGMETCHLFPLHASFPCFVVSGRSSANWVFSALPDLWEGIGGMCGKRKRQIDREHSQDSGV